MATIRLPANMRTKTLADRRLAYYWEVPSKDRRAGCTLANEALGRDPAAAIRRAEELNATLAAWRHRGAPPGPVAGTVAWLFAKVEAHPSFCGTRVKTQRSYRQGFRLIENFRVRSGKRFADMPADRIDNDHAEALYRALLTVEEVDPATGLPRRRLRVATAKAAMRAARRAWSLGQSKGWVKPAGGLSPFAHNRTSGLVKTPRDHVAVEPFTPTRAHVKRFIKIADAMGHYSMGTAVLLAFELCQREGDVIGSPDAPADCGFLWSGYKSPEAVGKRASEISLTQSKTRTKVVIPLYDETGPLYPRVVERLAKTPRRGSLIVMRDRPDRRTGRYERYKEDSFRHLFREIADAAGLPKEMEFRLLRHGGLTEMGNSGCTAQEMKAVSGHRSDQSLQRYVRPTREQALNGSRKRRRAATRAA